MVDNLERIGEILGTVGSPGCFTARRTATADDLQLEVQGLGQISLPVSRAQAERLCRLARPARYGRGEKTLLDRRVRDTWEIPRSRVKIDRRRWNRTLLPVLEELRADLGLADGCRLEAEIHSFLVYGPGQFFLPHQDSEKADAMVGTLVVTLPASFKGGELVVEHQGEKVVDRGSRRQLSFVAFYADCRHEVRPVKEGYRLALTYNWSSRGARPRSQRLPPSPRRSTPSSGACAIISRHHAPPGSIGTRASRRSRRTVWSTSSITSTPRTASPGSASRGTTARGRLRSGRRRSAAAASWCSRSPRSMRHGTAWSRAGTSPGAAGTAAGNATRTMSSRRTTPRRTIQTP
ncbi:2OG-Fe(II) oxygenase, partial [bacterium]